MICIFSNSIDQSTTDVIRWLHYLGEDDVIRINHDDPNPGNAVKIDVQEGVFSFLINDRQIHLKDIDAVWYRKGKHWLCDQFYRVTLDGYSKFTSYLNSRLQSEESKLAEYVHYIIENTVPAIGSSTKGNLNKLLVLSAAKEIGLLIPDFYITNYKEGIKNVFKHYPDLITKSISDGLYLFENTESETSYLTYTEKVIEASIELLPVRISPSLLQKNIAKKFELRVFFLEGVCYSMAIFSQSDDQTKIDFRKYNDEKPNRFVPYILPYETDKKIKQLFKKLNLNTGSADLLVDKNENIYFLEINSVGQFNMVSGPCNYFLEKQIALNLKAHATSSRTN